jgi:glutamine amidotransferase
MIGVIDYGMGNIFSVMNALRKIKANAEVIKKPIDLKKADAIIMPGVGSFDATMENLKPYQETLISALDSGTPFLGICMGLQALFERSEEGTNKGLGIIEGDVLRLPDNVMVPQMGWNDLKIKKETCLLVGIEDGDFFYFVHSYYGVPKDKKVIAATTEHGVQVTAAIIRDNIAAVQFHPEKSGEKGLLLLENFIRETKC